MLKDFPSVVMSWSKMSNEVDHVNTVGVLRWRSAGTESHVKPAAQL